MSPFVKGGGSGVEHFGEAARVHGRVELDGREIHAVRVDTGGHPATLSGVVGKVEEFEEDLVLFEREWK
jgi:hypothetical protein